MIFFQNGFLQYPILVSLDFHYTSSWRPNETFYSRFSKNIDIWLRNYFFENRLFQFLALFDEKRKQKCSFLAIIFEKMNKKMKKTVEPNKILWETRWWKKNFKNFHDLYSKKNWIRVQILQFSGVSVIQKKMVIFANSILKGTQWSMWIVLWY